MSEINTIDIKSDIVDNQTAVMYDFMEIPAVSPKSVSDQLNQMDPNRNSAVNINIASNGGDVFAASEIYTMLKNDPRKIIVNIQGLAASAASFIAMAGDHVNISPTAQIMIHKASSDVEGNADELQKEAAVLSKVDESITSAYEAKTGMNQKDLLKLMGKETWLTAQDALDNGFADEIMFVNEKQLQPVNSSSKIPSKHAVNKFMNLVIKAKGNEEAKAEPVKTEEPVKEENPEPVKIETPKEEKEKPAETTVESKLAPEITEDPKKAESVKQEVDVKELVSEIFKHVDQPKEEKQEPEVTKTEVVEANLEPDEPAPAVEPEPVLAEQPELTPLEKNLSFLNGDINLNQKNK